jgi:hypothetical protein
MRRAEDRDIIFLNFPRWCASRKDISHFLKPFEPDTVQEKPARLEVDILFAKNQKFGVRTFHSGLPSKAHEDELKSKVTKNGTDHVFTTTRYYRCPRLPGYAGACGLPYVDYSDAQTPFMGVHIAGKQDISIVAPIFDSDLENYAEMQCSVQDEDHPDVKSSLNSDLENEVLHVYPLIKGVDLYCDLDRKHYIPSTSRIIPTPFQEEIGDLPVMHEITRAPAKLSGDPSPLRKAMDKYGEVTNPVIHPKIIEYLNDDRIFAGCISDELYHAARQVLNLKQAIEGDPKLGIPPMDLSTGLGEPFTQMGITTKDCFDRNKPPTERCKQHGLSFYVSDQFLDEYEDALQDHMQKDVLPNYPVNDTLKDETRDLERVELHNTRLFDAGPKTHMLIYKRVLGHLVAHIEKSRDKSDIQVGINVHGVEWDHMFKRLSRFSKKKARTLKKKIRVFCGDFKRWDKSMLLLMAQSIARWMAKMMKFGPLMTMFVERALRAAFQAVHYNPIGVYRTRQGGTSGHYLTSILNSIYNSIIHRIAFNFLCPQFEWQFEKFVELLVYGDDSIGSCHDDVSEMYNMKTLQMFFKKYLGMDYTSPTKGSIDQPFMSIEDASFLKRKFASFEFNDKTYLVAQLEEDSIKNSIMWMEEKKTSVDTWETLCSTCDSYLMEYFKYGPQKFEYQRRQILARMKILAEQFNAKPYYYESFEDHFRKFCDEYSNQ